MLKKICCIVNYNLYESKNHFTLKMAEALLRHGIDVKIIDIQKSNSVLDLNEIQNFNPDLTCSFNSTAQMANGLFFWDLLQIPHWSILVDPSLYAVNLTNSPYSIISCVDRDDCTGLRSHNDFQNVFFWPHAVERELAPLKEGNRPYDVVFLGSCYDYESLRRSWQEKYPAKLNAVLDEAIDAVGSDRYTSLMDALIKAWGNSGLSPDGIDFVKLFYYLDNYTRGKDRVELIRSIKNAKVHLFGELMIEEPAYHLDWKHYLGDQKNVVLHPSVPFTESLEILKQSKICLNSMPFFKNGSHERVFTSLACGALPITSNSRYIGEMFQDGEDLVLYSSANWDAVNVQVDSLLANEKRRKEMAAKGRAKVMKEHTWDRRVEQLLNELPSILHRICQGQ